MRQLELSFVERNRHLTEQLQRAKGKRKECEKQNEKLRRQMLHMVKLDTIKNQQISAMEDRLQSFETKLRQHVSELGLDSCIVSTHQVKTSSQEISLQNGTSRSMKTKGQQGLLEKR